MRIGQALQHGAFTKEKIAVLAPMESARVTTTTTVNPGLRPNWRAANLRCRLLSITILLADKLVGAVLYRKYVDRSA
jgi:hypothetical protein